MSKICFFIGNMSHSGGTERVLSTIANGLSVRGHQIIIISLQGNAPSFFSIEKSVRVYWLRKKNFSTHILSNLRKLSGILKYEAPEYLVDVDIILCFYSLILKLRRRKMYWISWEHFNYYYHFRKNHNLRKAARRIAANFSDCLVVLSKEDRGYYEKNLHPKSRLIQLYNPNPYSQEYIMPKQNEEKIILAVGRLTRAKGFDLLIKSFGFLEKKYPDWTVIVAGEGEERGALEKQKEKAGIKNIHFIGNVKDIEPYYQKAAFFVLSSRDEGFGMVLLEAMDFSLPSVSYACKAGPSEIVIDGENGFLVRPGDVMKFAEKMEILIKDEELRHKMGKAARNSTKRFCKEKILDKWEKLCP